MPSPRRPFVSPEPGEDWNALAARVLPARPREEAVQSLKSWNLHLFTRMPSGALLGSDVVFTAPPLGDDSSLLGSVDASAFSEGAGSEGAGSEGAVHGAGSAGAARGA